MTAGLWLMLSAAWAGVTGPAAGGLDGVYAPRRVAVVIGIQDYDDPDLQGLRYASKDARDLGAALQDPALGGFDRVVVISGHDATTAWSIQSAIRTATADLQQDDTFLLYASGHGTLTVDPLDGSQLYLLPSDGLLDRPAETGIPVAWLEETISALPVRRRVLILDTCHNGRAGSRSALNDRTRQTLSTLRGEAPAPRAGLSVSENEARLFAAEYHQAALEAPELENGVYTHFLVEALAAARGKADLDRDGLVDVVEAHTYAMDATFRYTGGAQMPRAEYRITGREKIYLSGDPRQRSAAEQALLSAYDRVLASAQLLIDGIPRGGAVGAHPVEPGLHVVELQSASGKTISRRRVHLRAGTTTPLEDLLRPEAPHWTLSLGTAVRHGPGASEFHPLAGEAELAWVMPGALAPWLQPELHLRANGMTGPVQGSISESAGVVVDVTAGDVALGGSVGARWGGLSLGPQVEVVAPWRRFEDALGPSRQMTVLVAPGARALWSADVGALALSLRYDARWNPYVSAGAWTYLWQHGLAVGIGPQP